MLVSSKWLKGCHNWVKYSIWPGERLVWVCWTTHRTKWSNTNVMDTKLKISYHRGHHVLCDIPNNYCTGVNRHDILMLVSQWQPKRGLYPDIRQWRSVCVLFHEWGRVWRLHWWRMDAGHEYQWQTGNTNSFGCVHFWITSSSSRFAWFELLMNQMRRKMSVTQGIETRVSLS